MKKCRTMSSALTFRQMHFSNLSFKTFHSKLQIKNWSTDSLKPCNCEHFIRISSTRTIHSSLLFVQTHEILRGCLLCWGLAWYGQILSEIASKFLSQFYFWFTHVICHCYQVNDCSSKILVIRGDVHLLRHCQPFSIRNILLTKGRTYFF